MLKQIQYIQQQIGNNKFVDAIEIFLNFTQRTGQLDLKSNLDFLRKTNSPQIEKVFQELILLQES